MFANELSNRDQARRASIMDDNSRFFLSFCCSGGTQGDRTSKRLIDSAFRQIEILFDIQSFRGCARYSMDIKKPTNFGSCKKIGVC
jgi:hypothetical protein